MAKLEYSAVDDAAEKLEGLENELKRRIIRETVMAGAAKYGELLSAEIRAKHHVVSGSMAGNVKPGKYYETIGGGYAYVYPQGTDSRGVDNAQKAYIINYGYGGKRTARTGDRFITSLQRKAEDPVKTAMAEKFDACIKEFINK